MRFAKDGTVFPRAGWSEKESADEIHFHQDRDKRQVCNLPIYYEQKKLHILFRQHLAKHFCLCKYSSASYDSIYHHQRYEHCIDTTNNIYKVDKNRYSRFLRHMQWKTVSAFDQCVPTLNSEN